MNGRNQIKLNFSNHISSHFKCIFRHQNYVSMMIKSWNTVKSLINPGHFEKAKMAAIGPKVYRLHSFYRYRKCMFRHQNHVSIVFRSWDMNKSEIQRRPFWKSTHNILSVSLSVFLSLCLSLSLSLSLSFFENNGKKKTEIDRQKVRERKIWKL